MPFVESQGRRIYYERQGRADGPVVLFLHGAGSNAATWWQQLPAFGQGYSCITMDIRCFGRSVAPTEEFRFDLLVADALAVLDQEQVARAVVVGQSLGGMVGLRLALWHADRVAAFVACDSPLGIQQPDILERIARRVTTMAAVSIEQRSLGAWFYEHHPELVALYAQINHFNPSFHSVAPAAWREALDRLLAPASLLPVEAVADVRCPVLWLVGSEDPLIPVSAMAQCHALLPGSELLVVERAGHSAYFEMPRQVNAAALDFLARRLG